MVFAEPLSISGKRSGSFPIRQEFSMPSIGYIRDADAQEARKGTAEGCAGGSIVCKRADKACSERKPVCHGGSVSRTAHDSAWKTRRTPFAKYSRARNVVRFGPCPEAHAPPSNVQTSPHETRACAQC